MERPRYESLGSTSVGDALQGWSKNESGNYPLSFFGLVTYSDWVELAATFSIVIHCGLRCTGCTEQART
jgi:hypothetical protein